MADVRTAFDDAIGALAGRVYSHRQDEKERYVICGSKVHPEDWPALPRIIIYNLTNSREKECTLGVLENLIPIDPLSLTENESRELAKLEYDRRERAKPKDIAGKVVLNLDEGQATSGGPNLIESECNALRLERELKGYPMRDTSA